MIYLLIQFYNFLNKFHLQLYRNYLIPKLLIQMGFEKTPRLNCYIVSNFYYYFFKYKHYLRVIMSSNCHFFSAFLRRSHDLASLTWCYLNSLAMSLPKAKTIKAISSTIPTTCAAIKNLSLGLRPVTIS